MRVLTAEAMKAGMAKNQPIPRAGSVDDTANAAVFLASARVRLRHRGGAAGVLEPTA